MCEQGDDSSPARAAGVEAPHGKTNSPNVMECMEKQGKTETVRIEMHRGVHDVVGICRCFLTYTYI